MPRSDKGRIIVLEDRKPYFDAACGQWRVPLTRGYTAIIDEADVERVGRHNWSTGLQYSNDDPSAATIIDGIETTLGRFILMPPADAQVNHINDDNLDCRRANMRTGTIQQIRWRMRKTTRRPGITSSFKGVGYRRLQKKWAANIHIDGKNKFLGHFDFEVDAADAYDAAAIQSFGEFARLNFPGRQTRLAAVESAA